MQFLLSYLHIQKILITIDVLVPSRSFHFPEHCVWINKEYISPNEHRQKANWFSCKDMNNPFRTF